jgi:hypothetical protein
MAKCKQTTNTDFKNPNSVLKSLLNLFKIPYNVGTGIPKQAILAATCGGFNSSEIAAKIIKRQSEAGVPVGPLPSGRNSPAEIMERIRVEEMVEAITTKMVMDVAIQPGTVIQGTGGNAGGPVQIAGTIVGIAGGKAVVNPCA